MWHKKRSLLFIFFSFNAIHLKLCNNIEHTIPKKKTLLCFSDFGIFGGKMTSESSRQILFLLL